MIVALAAALSLASSLTIDVPYLPQTDALCGGAAAAMVFRYWGDAHADPQQFAPLIERRRGAAGIASDVLVRAIGSRGWRIERLDEGGASGALAALRARLAAREPVIVLLADRGNQYHYVVVTGVSDAEVILHDPSWGPARAIKANRFEALWRPSGHWNLVVLPSGRADRNASARPTGAVVAAAAGPVDACESSVQHAVVEVRSRGIAHADEILGSLRWRCGRSPALLRELAGVRFAQKRWGESESLARSVLAQAPNDVYAAQVLGSALFMQDRQIEALRAWNGIEQPTLDTVHISGLTRSRYQTIVDAIGLRSGALLTPDAFVRAQHRLEDLPDRASSRLSLRPGDDGFASVDVAIAERPGIPRSYGDWTMTAARAAIEREISASMPGFTGQGELWTASWRWWADRPAVALAFAAPRAAGFPGVWRVEGSWEAQTYSALAAIEPRVSGQAASGDSQRFGAALIRETRTHGGVTVSDWVRPRLRYSVTGGVDSFGGERDALFYGGALEQRLFGDRVAIAGDATAWTPVGSSAVNRGFGAIGVSARVRSTAAPRTWAFAAAAGSHRASATAPLAIWGGAGDGRARPQLLRAHPLLDGGIIDAGPHTVFGRTLRYASAEGQRWLMRPSVVRIGLAAFVDVAQASRRAVESDGPVQTDVGAGLRIRLPGSPGALRVDVAHGLRDGANAVTVGWIYF